MATKQSGFDSAFFGRRKGKPLREKQTDLLANFLPKIRPSSAQLSKKGKEFWLEIGFGGGEHLVALAASHPDVQFIGCEPFINGVAKAVSLVDARGVENVWVYDDEVSGLFAQLPIGSIGRVYVLYPDPWPKIRHHKRRLISEEFLLQLARVMKKGAELRFVTDIDDYAAWTLSRIQRSFDFKWTQQRPHEWLHPWAGWVSTRYEQKALKEGRGPSYLIFKRL